jgi:hypothetical protein
MLLSLSPLTLFLQTYWASAGKFVSAEQVLSLQVGLESFHDQEYADDSGEQHGQIASRDVVGSGSDVAPSTTPRSSHGVVQSSIRSQVATQGAAVVNVHDAAMSMHDLHLCAFASADPWSISMKASFVTA